MTTLVALVADLCQGVATARGTVPLALFAAGLASGVTHCAGMCGPFVLGQVAAASRGDGPLPWSARVRQAALVPYHLGRATTYGALGAGAGGLAWTVGWATGAPWLSPALLTVAALLLLAQAFGLAFHGHGRWNAALGDVVGRLRGGGPARRFGLGLLLGLLPCGVLYAALGAAASTGGALTGAVAMVAFAAGTFPGLLMVGVAGHGLARAAGSALRYAAALLLLLNAGTLGAIALGVAP